MNTNLLLIALLSVVSIIFAFYSLFTCFRNLARAKRILEKALEVERHIEQNEKTRSQLRREAGFKRPPPLPAEDD
jgi:hypothetical protein